MYVQLPGAKGQNSETTKDTDYHCVCRWLFSFMITLTASYHRGRALPKTLQSNTQAASYHALSHDAHQFLGMCHCAIDKCQLFRKAAI